MQPGVRRTMRTLNWPMSQLLSNVDWTFSFYDLNLIPRSGLIVKWIKLLTASTEHVRFDRALRVFFGPRNHLLLPGCSTLPNANPIFKSSIPTWTSLMHCDSMHVFFGISFLPYFHPFPRHFPFSFCFSFSFIFHSHSFLMFIPWGLTRQVLNCCGIWRQTPKRRVALMRE